MATKKTSTTMRQGQSPKPAAKANGAAKTRGANPKVPAKTSSKGKLTPKPAPAGGKAAPAARPARATTANRATKTAAPKRAPAKAASPAKSRSGKRPAAIVHWEIQSKQPEALHEFYGDVFGWTIDAKNEMNYGMVSSKGPNGGIDGGIGAAQGESPRVLVYALVTSIPTTLKRIEELGGKTIMPRTDIGPVVMAMYLDPEGNAMGLLEDR
jgi:predicted enzyme related to lactoylglutathione lyase